MDGLLRFLCLLCVFITSGHSLTCIKCEGTRPCTGNLPSETCQSGYSCGLAYRETTEGGNTRADYIRSCIPTSQCNKVGTISYTGGGRMKMGISCCDTDNCSPPLPQWPADSSQLSTLSCPSCRSTTNNVCTPETSVQCNSNEQTCIVASALTTAFRESAMGCATPSFCDLPEYSYKSSAYNIDMVFSCFSGSTSSATGTSCILCLSSNSLTCTGQSREIPTNYRCASAYRISSSQGTTYYEVFRSWAPINKCNVAGTLTASGARILMGISCCDGNDCTPSIQDTIPTNTLSNGVQCKTCKSMNSDSCETSNTMTCTGNENRCVTFAEKAMQGSQSATLSFRGCGTKTLCDAQSFSSEVDSFSLQYLFTCGSRNGGNTNGGNTNGGSTNGGSTNGGNSITTLSGGGVIFPFLSTAAVIFILHQFNKDL